MDTWKRWTSAAATIAALWACGSEDGAATTGASGTEAGDGASPGIDASSSPPASGEDAAAPAADAGGTGDAGPATDAGAADVPGSTEEELAAFLEAEGYRGDGWQAETPAPRDRANDVSPHGRVRVWHNATLRASQAKGNGENLDAPKHDTGSMAVKEFYDDSDTLLGRATMLKLEGDMREWAYYCGGPDDRCMDTAPVYGVGLGVSCSFCHGGLIYTRAP